MPVFTRSKVKNKKYSVITPSGKTINFGDTRYQHYQDRTGLGLYTNLNHNDKQRRAAYRSRHSKILLKNGTPAYLDKEQPSYYSYHFLW